MTFTALLDTAIGLTLLYLGAALFVTVANESIMALLKARGKDLTKSLAALLGAPGLQKVLADPAFAPMKDTADRVRSYVDPHVLAQVLVGSLQPQAPGAGKLTDLAGAINNLPDGKIKHVLWTLAQSADSKVETLTRNLSAWIDRSLTVLGEGYKRKMQLVSFILGFSIAFGFNIDTINVAKRLYRDKELREAVAASAEQVTKTTTGEVFERCRKLDAEARKKSAECAPIVGLSDAFAARDGSFAKLPVGWESVTQFREYGLPGSAVWFVRLLGWLLTALAISIGAPFWFDLLNRFVNVRASMRPPTAEKEK
jgi:hypothetical protein